jgi:hypothetical protein
MDSDDLTLTFKKLELESNERKFKFEIESKNKLAKFEIKSKSKIELRKLEVEERVTLAKIAEGKNNGVFISSSAAMDTYAKLLAAVEDDLCLTIDEGSFFPLSSFEKFQKPGHNKVLARKCTKNLFDIFHWIVKGNKFEGKTRKGAIVTGPPGDGKVSAT